MKCAIVTGAGSGIGRGVALRLAWEGYGVALVGRRAGPLEEVAVLMRREGGEARVMAADVTKDGEMAVMVAKAVNAFGRVDVLVNCAGSAPAAPLAKLTAEKWREIMETNLSSAFYTMRAVWPVMQRQYEEARAGGAAGTQAGAERGMERGIGGVIVNISSLASKDPFAGLGAYGAAKAGLNMLTLAAGREGKDAGIRVVAIAPAAVDTAMFHALVGGKPVQEGVMLTVEDVVEMVMAAIDGALRHCSGDTIFVHRRPR